MFDDKNNRRTDDIDHRLITEFKDGSPDAMTKIVERYEKSLFSFGLRMCGHVQDAEDIMQETFMSALKGLHTFREETKLKNWLFRIAAHACMRKRRKKKCEPDREISLDSIMPNDGSKGHFEIPDWSNDPRDAALRAELKSIIDDCMGQLPPKYRIVLNLRDIEGFNTEETAEILGITSQSVKTRLHRARLFLRKGISDHFDGGQSDA
jgi:RNA polymerase sigma-70 factor (ECF subfamily)